MLKKSGENERVFQDAVRQIHGFGLKMTPARLRSCLGGCNADLVSIAMTSGSNQMLVVLELEDFSEEICWEDQ